MNTFKQRGGGEIGGFYNSWPFGSITVSAGSLTVSALKRVTFTPDEVIAVEPFGWIPILWEGVRIHHKKTGCAEYVRFFSPHRTPLLNAIAAAGFPIGKYDPWTRRVTLLE